ncbi:GNAT family N-acetyltransferase [Ferrimonas marina]|uniref:GNAT family N-acetyltransferase n=1 Tax=Ferrimonas marina TaxID=299255 RepID=UPI00146FCA40|nr:GNAT family N-acetyltransferase [Ferrimonas marina]
MTQSNVEPRLRPWQAEDLPALQALFGDADSVRWLGPGQPLTELECQFWLSSQLNGKAEWALQAITQGDEVVGFAGLLPGPSGSELLMALLPAYRRQGLAKAALNQLLQSRLTTLVGTPVMASVADANQAGLALLKACGFAPVAGAEGGWQRFCFRQEIDQAEPVAESA